MSLSFLRFVAPLAAAALAFAASPALAKGRIVANGKSGPAAAAVQDYEPRPAIWLVEDADTKIYLFGTVHILPPGFRWRSPALERVIAAADELVVETYEAPGTDDFDEAAGLLFLDRPEPILERVPGKHRETLRAAIEQSGAPVEFYDSMRTWVAAMAIGVAQLLEGYGADDPGEAPGVEDVLEEQFRAAKKPISSVEDPLDVVRAMNALPPAVQVEMLVSGFEADIEAAGAEAAEGDRQWATGRVDRLGEEMREALPAGVYDALLTRRNAAWTEWLARRLERPGTVLFAVGAGHLAGADSVQKMLEARGVATTRFD
jgi:uncharacterized protein YbaP (TraB family)